VSECFTLPYTHLKIPNILLWTLNYKFLKSCSQTTGIRRAANQPSANLISAKDYMCSYPTKDGKVYRRVILHRFTTILFACDFSICLGLLLMSWHQKQPTTSILTTPKVGPQSPQEGCVGIEFKGSRCEAAECGKPAVNTVFFWRFFGWFLGGQNDVCNVRCGRVLKASKRRGVSVAFGACDIVPFGDNGGMVHWRVNM